MKKILIGLMFLVGTSVFADTLSVVKGRGVYAEINTYKNMRMSKIFTTAASIKNNEYIINDLGLYYRIDGKLYLTTMYEIEFD